MGRRAAKGLDSMVGDVARNHTVRKNNSIGGAAATATGFFAKRKVDMAASAKTKAVCDDGGQGKAHGASSSKRIDVKGESDVRQSVIVLEEVDLLFRKEEDFWSGESSISIPGASLHDCQKTDERATIISTRRCC